jgi:hypothetical protein
MLGFRPFSSGLIHTDLVVIVANALADEWTGCLL